MVDQQTIDELRKAARCAPIAMDAVVADDIARILNGAADALDEMLANGPAMQRGTNADGATLMGTMREVMEDYKAAAEAEAKAADEARRENERLRALVGEMREDIMSWLKHSENLDVDIYEVPSTVFRTPEEELHSNELIHRADAAIAEQRELTGEKG